MGQDKKQLSQLLTFIKDLYDNPDNKEFAAGIQAIVLKDIKTGQSKEEWTAQINEIYELCLRKNLREQAEDLYKNFPITSIAGELADLYIKMEDARRANDFDGFGRFLFLQIELIVGAILSDKDFIAAYEGIRGLKPITKFDYAKKASYRTDFVRYIKDGDGQSTKVAKDTVDKFLFTSADSIGKPLTNVFAIEKCRAVMYVVHYEANVSAWPTADFDTLSGIYNVRNHESHTGGNTTGQQLVYYEKIIADKSQNYLRFLGFLLMFIKGITEHYPLGASVRELAGTAK